MKTKRNKRVAQRRTTCVVKPVHHTKPFIAHLIELRRRAFIVAMSVAAGATTAYFVQQKLVAVLLKPAGDQQFIYTTPGGGLNFLIMICIYTGFILSIPVIIYNILKFIEPVMWEDSSRYILRGSAMAGLLALAGVCFGYFVGLPSALKFLSHQFVTDQVTAMIAIQSYTGFVSKFLLASALIFQAPLIMMLINHIKPLNPAKLLKSEKWVIIGSMLIGAIISPTPDIRSMLLMAVPIFVTYQIGIGIVWYANRHNRQSKSILALLEQDAAAQAERLQLLEATFLAPLHGPEMQPAVVRADAPDYNLNQSVTKTNLTQSSTSASMPIPRLPGGRADYQKALSTRHNRQRIF
jgi:sec-independent protein translocase protein TatC